MLVSIGVTCWQLGQQARALELTRAGANLVELAVEDGILARSSLSVPYSNLATMYEQMGETTNAAKYSQLAKSLAAPAAAPVDRARPASMPASARARSEVMSTIAKSESFGPRPQTPHGVTKYR